ncbi:MAG: tetratricopeptide repeat protein [Muribaculaceae bacterium]|nr:tetratricopeptide repeat protein [Muribaculaceae bacterium]
MKKIAIVGACVAAAFAANAQQNVVKDAERALKEGKSEKEVVEIITPAFTNPETAQQVLTWYIPGKAAYKEYDDLLGKKAFGKLPEGGEVLMGNLLIDGYNYYMKALPFDSLPNEKGKIKPKYSKEMYSTVAGHYTDLNNAAIAFWEAKDYDKAFTSWELFCTIPSNPEFGVKAPADSTMGEIRYNQALAAWQNENFDAALQSFIKAKNLGYNKKNLYDYAIAVATAAKNDDAVYDLAKEANGIYGKEDPNYVGYMINRYLQNREFDQAYAVIDEAIATDPTNAQYVVVKGILLSENDKKDEAKEHFKKALSLDPNNSMALYQYGRALCEEAYKLGEVAPTSPAESQKFFDEKIQPLFLEAAQVLERAYDEDNNNTDALRYLENVYYNLHDEAKLQDVQNRLK